MNIKKLSVIALAASLVACNDYDPGVYTEEELTVLNEYTTNFEERYGEMDPEHSWGFSELGSVDEVASEASTRTSVGPNINEWVKFDIDNDYNVSEEYTTVDNMEVPGFPSYVDGVYYTTEATGTWDDVASWLKNNNQQSIHPAGDVTDEEILYVSAWFRTHPNPTRDNLDVDKYFVQAISKDYDRSTYGTMTDEGKSNWAETKSGVWDKTATIYHYDKDGNMDATEGTRELSFGLDHLEVMANISDNWQHIYNFNSGNTAQIAEASPTTTISGTSYRTMQYVYDSGTYNFRTLSSDANLLYENWTLKHLTFTGKSGKQYDGWYLAFDYSYDAVDQTYGHWDAENNVWVVEGVEKRAIHPADGYYSNYIVKITPGKERTNTSIPIIKSKTARVMCEDLGNTYDFDFNDLVFDVYYTGNSTNGYTANITVQAVGGTLPIYIVGCSTELHALMSAETYQPVNVNAATTATKEGVSRTPVKITIPGYTNTNPDNIVIKVYGSAAGKTTTTDLPPSSKAAGDKRAPQKICVASWLSWPDEGVQIEDVYTGFRDWVANESNKFWTNLEEETTE